MKKVVRPRRDEVRRTGDDYITRSVVIFTPHQILFE
jgi:hypothetical protein